jgi:hypothetical protein
MYLDIFRAIRDFFSSLFSKFSISNLFILLSGVALGFVLCFLIYILFIFIGFKKGEKELINISIDNEEVEKIIKSAKNQFIEESSNSQMGDKVKDVVDISWHLINDIAKVYFPESKYPIYELSIDELMSLNHYITERVNTMFKGPILKPLKRIRISYILKIVDTKKKVDDNKVVKAATKLNKPWSAAMSVLNIFNPVYWVKKVMVTTTITAVTNKICEIMIDVVGEETNKVYSKSVFDIERKINLEIEKELLELEQLTEEH